MYQQTQHTELKICLRLIYFSHYFTLSKTLGSRDQLPTAENKERKAERSETLEEGRELVGLGD